MNRTETTVQKTKKQTAGQANGSRPPYASQKSAQMQTLALIRCVILILCAVIVLLGTLLLVLPMFRVKTIEVVGNRYYTPEQIAQTAMIEVGDEILTIDVENAYDQIFEQCAYVSSVKIVRYPFKVRIEIEERENVTVTEYNGSYYTLSDRFLVLEQSDSVEAFEKFPLVTLPEIEALSVGSYVEFSNAAEPTYLFDLMNALKQAERFDEVVSIDCSQKFHVSYVKNDRFRVELGSVSDMGTKLELVDLILLRKAGESDLCAVVDVSNLKKPTFRAVGMTELRLG